MKKLIAVCLICFFESSMADDWVCKSQSSQVIGHVFLSCGIGVDVNLSKAREIARDNAVKEFETLCLKSDKCRKYEISVNPKRTDCSLVDGKYHCYRGVEFQLTNHLKKDLVVDIGQIESQLILKKQELNKLNRVLDSLVRSQKINQEIMEKKRLIEDQSETLDKESIKLARMVSNKSVGGKEYKYTHLLYKNSLRVYGAYYGLNFGQSSEVNIGLGLEYEWRPVHFIGIFGGVAWGGDFQGGLIRSDSEIPNIGTPGSTESRSGEQNFRNLFVGLTFYPQFYGVYFKGSVGQLKSKREIYSISYNNLGVGSSEKVTVDWESTIYKVSIGYDHRDGYKGFGWFVDIGGMSVEKTSEVDLVGSFGFNFGF